MTCRYLIKYIKICQAMRKGCRIDYPSILQQPRVIPFPVLLEVRKVTTNTDEGIHLLFLL